MAIFYQKFVFKYKIYLNLGEETIYLSLKFVICARGVFIQKVNQLGWKVCHQVFKSFIHFWILSYQNTLNNDTLWMRKKRRLDNTTVTWKQGKRNLSHRNKEIYTMCPNSTRTRRILHSSIKTIDEYKKMKLALFRSLASFPNGLSSCNGKLDRVTL